MERFESKNIMGRIPSDKQIPNEPEKRLNPSRHPESVTGTVFSKRKHKTCVIKRDSTTFHSLGIVEHERFVIDTRGGRVHVERKRKRGERGRDGRTIGRRAHDELSISVSIVRHPLRSRVALGFVATPACFGATNVTVHASIASLVSC